MTKVTLPDGKEVQYKYDALGRRVQKIAEGEVTNYIYHGWQVIMVTDERGELLVSYIYGTGIDEPLVIENREQSTEDRYYYHFDGLGSVTGLTDEQGNLVESYSYDVYGKPFIFNHLTNQPFNQSSVGNPYLFTGRRYDGESGLYYFRYRYYNPELGRFMTREPRPTLAETNLYTYVSDNPVSRTDPLGLWSGFAVYSYWHRMEEIEWATRIIDTGLDRRPTHEKAGEKFLDRTFEWHIDKIFKEPPEEEQTQKKESPEEEQTQKNETK